MVAIVFPQIIGLLHQELFNRRVKFLNDMTHVELIYDVNLQIFLESDVAIDSVSYPFCFVILTSFVKYHNFSFVPILPLFVQSVLKCLELINFLMGVIVDKYSEITILY